MAYGGKDLPVDVVLDADALASCQLPQKQVAQLSLTNPRDALHHDKRQNFKTVM